MQKCCSECERTSNACCLNMYTICANCTPAAQHNHYYTFIATFVSLAKIFVPHARKSTEIFHFTCNHFVVCHSMRDVNWYRYLWMEFYVRVLYIPQKIYMYMVGAYARQKEKNKCMSSQCDSTADAHEKLVIREHKYTKTRGNYTPTTPHTPFVHYLIPSPLPCLNGNVAYDICIYIRTTHITQQQQKTVETDIS